MLEGGTLDQASILARQDPDLPTLKLIPEPWYLGLGGYQLGNHLPRSAEWNDKYRDAVRRYRQGDLMFRIAALARSLVLLAANGTREAAP
jgi:pullulanase/glycogen debranching enzyme